MGRRAALSDDSEDSAESEYGSARGGYRLHRRNQTESGVSARLRPRNRRAIVYQDVGSDLDDFLASEEEDGGEAKDPAELPVALYLTIERFLDRRPAMPRQDSDLKTLLKSEEAFVSGPEVANQSEILKSPPSQSLKGEGDTGESDGRSDENKTDQLMDGGAVQDANSAVATPAFPKEEVKEALSISGGLSKTPHKFVPSGALASPELGDGPSGATTPGIDGRPDRGKVGQAPSDTPSSAQLTKKRKGFPSGNTVTLAGGGVEYEYLVKYNYVSYLHCEWLSEKEVEEAIEADRSLKTRFNNFIKKLEKGEPIPEKEHIDVVPDRIVDSTDQFRALYPTKAAEVGRNDWNMYCLKIVDAVACFERDHRKYGVPFIRPVDEEKDGAPGYYTHVKNPMDLGSIQTKLYLRQYDQPQDFWSDMKLVFSNCLEYNAPHTEISTQCRVLEKLFDKLYNEWAMMSRGPKDNADEEKEIPFVELSEPDLTIEKVIQHVSFKRLLKNPDRLVLYLVKWKRLPYTFCSWEAPSDIADKMKIAQYHRHVRVPEYLTDPRGPALMEMEMQRRMIHETLFYCKAAREYLHGSLNVGIALPPMDLMGGERYYNDTPASNTGRREYTRRTNRPYENRAYENRAYENRGYDQIRGTTVPYHHIQQQQQQQRLEGPGVVGRTAAGFAGGGGPVAGRGLGDGGLVATGLSQQWGGQRGQMLPGPPGSMMGHGPGQLPNVGGQYGMPPPDMMSRIDLSRFHHGFAPYGQFQPPTPHNAMASNQRLVSTATPIMHDAVGGPGGLYGSVIGGQRLMGNVSQPGRYPLPGAGVSLPPLGPSGGGGGPAMSAPGHQQQYSMPGGTQQQQHMLQQQQRAQTYGRPEQYPPSYGSHPGMYPPSLSTTAAAAAQYAPRPDTPGSRVGVGGTGGRQDGHSGPTNPLGPSSERIAAPPDEGGMMQRGQQTQQQPVFAGGPAGSSAGLDHCEGGGPTLAAMVIPPPRPSQPCPNSSCNLELATVRSGWGESSMVRSNGSPNVDDDGGDTVLPFAKRCRVDLDVGEGMRGADISEGIWGSQFQRAIQTSGRRSASQNQSQPTYSFASTIGDEVSLEKQSLDADQSHEAASRATAASLKVEQEGRTSPAHNAESGSTNTGTARSAAPLRSSLVSWSEAVSSDKLTSLLEGYPELSCRLLPVGGLSNKASIIDAAGATVGQRHRCRSKVATTGMSNGKTAVVESTLPRPVGGNSYRALSTISGSPRSVRRKSDVSACHSRGDDKSDCPRGSPATVKSNGRQPQLLVDPGVKCNAVIEDGQSRSEKDEAELEALTEYCEGGERQESSGAPPPVSGPPGPLTQPPVVESSSASDLPIAAGHSEAMPGPAVQRTDLHSHSGLANANEVAQLHGRPSAQGIASVGSYAPADGRNTSAAVMPNPLPPQSGHGDSTALPVSGSVAAPHLQQSGPTQTLHAAAGVQPANLTSTNAVATGQPSDVTSVVGDINQQSQRRLSAGAAQIASNEQPDTATAAGVVPAAAGAPAVADPVSGPAPQPVAAPPTPKAPPILDRSKPATFAARSPYAEQFAQLKKPKPPPPGVSRTYPVSPIFKGNRKLFDYQLEGLDWMISLWAAGNNGILADEMGLGKTIQSMAFLWHLHTKERMRGPFLVVAPLSTLGHWKRSAEDWTDLNVVVYYDEAGKVGRDALRRVEWFHSMVEFRRQPPSMSKVEPRVVATHHYKFQLILTSYEIFTQDAELLAPIPWQFVIVDEAHKLKNRLSKTLHLLRQVACRHTLLLTGTPVQNNTEELWPLLNYIEPVRFCDVEAFKVEFGELQTQEQVTRLTELLRPHLLRRVKEDVAESIPPLEETIIDVELTMLQKAYYKAIFERNKNFLFKSLRKGQAAPSLMNVEMELRKCCNHPFMITGVEEREYASCKTEAEKFQKLIESSGKMVLLNKLLPKLKAEGHKVLIFSQFQHTLTLLQEFLIYQGWAYERLDGQVKGTDRSSAISRFNDPASNSFVFLLSTRAGGLGINLTSADTVVIFDSDWNPQNDIQATARAHRIGQEREVKVYRLVTSRTYESDMFDRASKKLGLNTAVFYRGAFDSKSRGGAAATAPTLSEDGTQLSSAKAPTKEEVEDMLKKGAYYLLENTAEASKEFQESDIEDILSRKSRLVRYQVTGMSSSFAKTSFRSDKASDLSLDDPDFWQKILNDSSSRRLLARLNDGSATMDEEAMADFMSDLEAVVKGIAAEDDPVPTIEALVQLTNLTTFSSQDRQKAEMWLAEVNAYLETTGQIGSTATTAPASGGGEEASGENGRGGSGLRRSTRVTKVDSIGGYWGDDQLYWMIENDGKEGKSGGRVTRKSTGKPGSEGSPGGDETADGDVNEEASEEAADGSDGEAEGGEGGDETAAAAKAKVRSMQSRLLSKLREADQGGLYRHSFDAVLAESSSDESRGDDDDDDDGDMRTSLAKRNKGKKKVGAKAKSKGKAAAAVAAVSPVAAGELLVDSEGVEVPGSQTGTTPASKKKAKGSNTTPKKRKTAAVKESTDGQGEGGLEGVDGSGGPPPAKKKRASAAADPLAKKRAPPRKKAAANVLPAAEPGTVGGVEEDSASSSGQQQVETQTAQLGGESAGLLIPRTVEMNMSSAGPLIANASTVTVTEVNQSDASLEEPSVNTGFLSAAAAAANADQQALRLLQVATAIAQAGAFPDPEDVNVE